MPSNVCTARVRSSCSASSTRCAAWCHDECSEQSPAHTEVRRLVGVVPVGTHLIGAEPVDELIAGCHDVLGHARCAVFAARHVVAVPVQGHSVVDVGVAQCHLDQIARGGGDRRTGYLAVVGPCLDLTSGREPDAGGLRGEHVLPRRAARCRCPGPPQVGDRHGRSGRGRPSGTASGGDGLSRHEQQANAGSTGTRHDRSTRHADEPTAREPGFSERCPGGCDVGVAGDVDRRRYDACGQEGARADAGGGDQCGAPGQGVTGQEGHHEPGQGRVSGGKQQYHAACRYPAACRPAGDYPGFGRAPRRREQPRAGDQDGGQPGGSQHRQAQQHLLLHEPPAPTG